MLKEGGGVLRGWRKGKPTHQNGEHYGGCVTEKVKPSGEGIAAQGQQTERLGGCKERESV